ncbi:glycosyltransferase-like protein [Candidatus Moduliflexus flocculans]|uniref:Glycosyltransferase-like protein n=1 Tax=Candidatus Moduliflexus flocculans TaxID=1499966 RepID=A0A081BMU7_9BACT|nr:glycosyltransferase-like protein [Candidatus Moduliflexus flocculans]
MIIPTFNRAEILQECLESLVNQTIDRSLYEVLIINNNSTDNTEYIITQYTSRYANMRGVFEPMPGLSHARNRGYKEAHSAWCFYLDDDAKARPDTIARALEVIEQYPFDCFGGVYYGWWKYGRPRWLPQDFGDKPLELQETGILTRENALCTGYNSGGVFVCRKSVLEKVNGFVADLGMNSGKIGYGEETYLQDILRSNEYVIGFDPLLVVDHLVGKHKLTIWWHLKSIYASQRDAIFLVESTLTLKRCILTIGWEMVIFPFKFIKYLHQLIFHKNYYWQTFILDLFSPLFRKIGLLSGFMR